jgi:hypothetical protein
LASASTIAGVTNPKEQACTKRAMMLSSVNQTDRLHLQSLQQAQTKKCLSDDNLSKLSGDIFNTHLSY